MLGTGLDRSDGYGEYPKTDEIAILKYCGLVCQFLTENPINFKFLGHLSIIYLSFSSRLRHDPLTCP